MFDKRRYKIVPTVVNNLDIDKPSLQYIVYKRLGGWIFPDWSIWHSFSSSDEQKCIEWVKQAELLQKKADQHV